MRLADVLESPTPPSIVWMALLIPVLQGVLLHYRGTKLLRLALAPLALYCGFVSAFSRNEHVDIVNRLRLAQVFMHFVRSLTDGCKTPYGGGTGTHTIQDLACGIKFALASQPPKVASPSNPYSIRLRSNPLVRTLITLASETTLNLRPNTAAPHRFTWTMYFNGLWYHLTRLIFTSIIADLATYPIWALAPNTFGAGRDVLVPGDFWAWCAELGARWGGIPAGVVMAGWTVMVMFTTGAMNPMIPHLSGLLFIGTGFASPEEFPEVMHNPLKSSSFNEFWGTRYHQLLRPFFEYVASPFKSTKSVYIMVVFLWSMMYHISVYYPLTHPTNLLREFWPYILFYVGHGLGCVLEREYYKRTGKKMGGWTGWCIFWGTMLLLGMPTAAREYGIGWGGRLRSELGGPQASLAAWVAYALGYGPHPASFASARAVKTA